MKTFSLASAETNRGLIRKMAADLRDWGMRWYSNWDWTAFVGKDLTDEASRAGLVCGDLIAAVGCEVFVLVLREETPVTLGASSEFGARLASGKETYVILNGRPDHLFFHHPSVKTFDHWDAFVEWLKIEYGLTHRRLISDRLPKVD